MPKIKVHFNQLFRDIAGKEEEEVELADATLEGLVRALERSFGDRFTYLLRDSQRQLRPGVTSFVNGEHFPGWETPLADGDEVVFFFIIGG